MPGTPTRLTRLQLRAAVLTAALLAPASWAQPVLQPPAEGQPPKRELLRDFFDSLSDVALTLDRLQIYQRNGHRREVDLGGDVILSLDEIRPSLLSNPRGTPFGAGRGARVLGLSTQRDRWWAETRYIKRDDIRFVGIDGAWRLTERWSVIASTADMRSDLAEVPGDPVAGLRRRDREGGLQWQGTARGGIRLRSSITVRRSTLTPAPATALAPAGRGTFLFWRTQAQWPDLPDLSVGAVLAHPVQTPEGQPDSLNKGRAELNAEWRLGPGHAIGFLPEGSRLAWREAPRLGVLSDDEALRLTAAYHRSLALEVPDGSDDGTVYGQLRQRSLASSDDTQAAIGWRHTWRRPSGWAWESRVEQAVPVSGPNSIRATQLGGRVWRSDFPRRSVTADASAVTGTQADSVYAGGQLIQRLADDWLSAWQLSGSHAQPHGRPNAGVDEYKASATLGWREPRWRSLYVLGRAAWAGRDTAAAYADPAIDDRTQWIGMGHVSLLLGDQDTVTLRTARRIEHDEVANATTSDPRTTTTWLTRWTREVSGTRWSLSGHVAERRDSTDGHDWSYGAEIGWRLSSRLTLTLGVNPKGFSDNELTLDERPQEGVVLRIRFSIERVLDRWLDAGRSDGAAPVTGWFEGSAFDAALRPAASSFSPSGIY